MHRMSLLPLIVTLLAACAAPGPQRTAQSGGGAAPSAESRAPKRITAAIKGDPNTVVQKLNPASRIPGIETLEELTNAGLSNLTFDNTRRAQLAEAVPSIENGLWKVMPDGRMEVT